MGSNPYPPGLPPPPFGVCPPGQQTVLVPCWQWNPTGNNGGGSWIFVPPGGSSGGTTTTPPITPVQSLDPNAIVGPSGTGVAQYISGRSPLGYTVFFGNDPGATAPAQQVLVTEPLNPAVYNLSTLALGPMTFPGQVISPPSLPLVSLGNFFTQVDLRPTTNLLCFVHGAGQPHLRLLQHCNRCRRKRRSAKIDG
jgi:hypothetical protein